MSEDKWAEYREAERRWLREGGYRIEQEGTRDDERVIDRVAKEAEVSDMVERAEDLEEALWRIVQWSEAYPIDIFHEPTKNECARAHAALVGIGLSLDIFSASMARHVVKGIGDIARAALAEKETVTK